MTHHYDGPDAEEKGIPEKKSITDAINQYKETHEEPKTSEPAPANIASAQIPQSVNTGAYNPEQFQNMMQKETDPDLMIAYEIVKLPSKGMFYSHKTEDVEVEYMTSKDEDLLTTPSLLDSGKVLDLLLKRKVKTKGINPEDLLPGDRNAIILFLRTSSYGNEYNVSVTDPRTGVVFEQKVDLLKLQYKEMKEMPDVNGYFHVELPMRKKTVIFRLMSAGEEDSLFKKAEAMKDAFGLEFSEFNTLKLKSHIISIDGNSDRNYIDKFVDAMPALDAYTIRKKILTVSPDVDMEYEFTANDGYKFKAQLSVGIDFFFPGN